MGMNNLVEKIISGSLPVEYIRKSVLTLSYEDSPLLKDLTFIKESKGSFSVSEELTATDLKEKISQEVYVPILRKTINNTSEFVKFFVVVYKVSQDSLKLRLTNMMEVEFALYEFSVKGYDRAEILALQKLYDHIEQDVETDKEIFAIIEKLLNDTEIPRQVERLMGEEFDMIKYYDENLKPEEYVEIKAWGITNTRMVKQ